MRVANFKIDYSQPLNLLDGGKVSLGGLYEHQEFDTESKGITNLDYTRQTTATYLEFQAKLKNLILYWEPVQKIMTSPVLQDITIKPIPLLKQILFLLINLNYFRMPVFSII